MPLITTRGAQIHGLDPSNPTTLSASAQVKTDFPIWAQFLRGFDIPSFSFINPGGPEEYFHITGTTTMSFFGTGFLVDGRTIVLYFVSGLTLNHNAASPPGGTVPYRLSGGANVAVPAGQAIVFKYDATVGAMIQIGGYVVAAGGGTVNQVHAGTGISITGTLADPIINNTGVLVVSAGTGGITVTGSTSNPIVNLPPQPVEQVLFSSGSAITSDASFKFNVSKGLYLGARLQENAAVASFSGGIITLPANANTAPLGLPGGLNTINGVATANWQNGARVTILFGSTGAALLRHGASPGGGAAPLFLYGGQDITVPANTIYFLHLYYDTSNGLWWQTVRDTQLIGAMHFGATILNFRGGAGLDTLTSPLWLGHGVDDLRDIPIEWSIDEYIKAGATKVLGRVHVTQLSINFGGNVQFLTTKDGTGFATSGDVSSPGPSAYYIPSTGVPVALPGSGFAPNMGICVAAGTGYVSGTVLEARTSMYFYS